MGKLNNQQRRSLCQLVDGNVKFAVDKVDMSDATMLKLVTAKLKENKNYAPLSKEYDRAFKAHQKKQVDIQKKIQKLDEELNASSKALNQKREAIKQIGINTDTGNVVYDKRWVGKNYRDERYQAVVFGDNKNTWNSITAGLKKDIEDIKANGVKLKEKIWLCETTESAKQLMEE